MWVTPMKHLPNLLWHLVSSLVFHLIFKPWSWNPIFTKLCTEWVYIPIENIGYVLYLLLSHWVSVSFVHVKFQLASSSSSSSSLNYCHLWQVDLSVNDSYTLYFDSMFVLLIILLTSWLPLNLLIVPNSQYCALQRRFLLPLWQYIHSNMAGL